MSIIESEIRHVRTERITDEKALEKIKAEGGCMLAFVYYVPDEAQEGVGKLKVAEAMLSSDTCEKIAATFLHMSVIMARMEDRNAAN